MKFACIVFAFIIGSVFGDELIASDGQNCTIQFYGNGNEKDLEFSPYPITANESCSIYKWTVNVSNYDIDVDVTVDYLDLDATSHDFLIISPGPVLINDDSSIMMTGKIKSRHLRIVNVVQVFVMLVIQERAEDSKNFTGFKLTFDQYGNTTTAGPTTSPATTLPSAPSDVDDDATLYLTGTTVKDFRDKNESFRAAMIEMAATFCSTKGIILTDPPSIHVSLELVTQCPLGWPNWGNCIKVVVKIPVLLNESNGYELTRAHIYEMWNTMADSRMSVLGLQVYQEPNADASMVLWVGVALGVIVIFVIFVFGAWKLQSWNTDRKMPFSQLNNVGRVSEVSNKSWISEATYEVPPMISEENSEKSTPPNPTANQQRTTAPPVEFMASSIFSPGYVNRGFQEIPEEADDSEEEIGTTRVATLYQSPPVK